MVTLVPDSSVRRATSKRLQAIQRSIAASMQAEMTSRLRRSLVEFKNSSGRWSRGLAALSIVVIALTLVLVYLAWALLNKTHG